MKNRFMLSPSFLDLELPSLELQARPDWIISKPFLPTWDRQNRVACILQPIADFVAQTIRRGERPVSITGDCCQALGVMAGLQRADVNPTLLWFDAHGDFNTWDTTLSGFLGGMPLAMLVGRGELRMSQALKLKPFPEDRVILINARDLDPAEQELIFYSDITCLAEVRELLKYTLPEGPLYIHFDVDVVNPEEVPAVNGFAKGGPSAAEIREVFRYLANTGRIAAVSVASWNPLLDKEQQSQKICVELLDVLLS